MNEYRQLELNAKTNKRKEEYKYFVGTTLKNSLEYKIFEKIIFKIRTIPYILKNYIHRKELKESMLMKQAK